MAAAKTPLEDIVESLGPRLSSKGQTYLISDTKTFSETFTSWSDFNKKVPSAVIKIHTVLWLTSNSVPFVIKAGGHGNFCTIGKEGVIIDLSNMKRVTLHEDSVTVEAGILTDELISTLYPQGRCVVSGGCGGVGVSGSCLAGGLGPLIGLHGLISDNILSARVITAAGELIEVSKTKNPDLFWALRGAGMRFGFVVELTFRTYPLSTLGSDDGSIWEMTLMWGEEQLEDLVEALNGLGWTKGEAMGYFGFVHVKEKESDKISPVCLAILHYFGPTSAAEEYFKPLLSLSPFHALSPPPQAQPVRIPYNLINALQVPSQKHGGFKSLFGVGVQRLSVPGMRKIWDRYTQFVSTNPDAYQSAVLVELFSVEKVREVGRKDDTAFPHRDVNIWALPQLWYNDPSTEPAATKFGNEVRKMLQDEDFGSGGKVKAYVNFNRGDESIIDTYGSKERVARLQELKKEWDPRSLFGDLVPSLK
ncbi:uncharacterized protein LAJ45_04621 [Morchella importuna]|uniref:uncharacterized protein n=1 Tax=Morchella importuna TaxID=1174673 RepID=UPI001E8E5F6E|nr:uncharacterized protein LAJ45_04621 [Morchella importuna]KAH8151416.1 hypothetical protein LAJ45_04621 [Morchella importuna]